MTSVRERYDLGLIIPTKAEFDFISQSVPFEPVLDKDGDFWFEFDFPGQRSGIARVLFGVGLATATVTADRLLERFSPQVLAIVGIGGALSTQLRLGDVVVGSFIQEYLRDAMVTKDADGQTSFKPAGDGWPLAERMLRFANHFRNFNIGIYDSWVRLASIRGLDGDLPFVTTPGARREAEYFVLPIASGDLVVNDPAFRDWLLSHDRKRAVVEMESAGAARAVKEYDKDVVLLVLRGISDFADGRKLAFDAAVHGNQAGAWRSYAARNAIELLLAFAAAPMFPWRTPAPSDAGPPDPASAAAAKEGSRLAWDFFVRGLPVLGVGALGAEIDRALHRHEPSHPHEPSPPVPWPHVIAPIEAHPNGHDLADPHTDGWQ